MKELEELVNEWRRCADAADAAKALLLEAFEAQGVRKAEAAYTDAAGTVHHTTCTYRKAAPDGLTFDKAAFCAAPERAALYAAFCTKPRKGSAATVSFTRKTVKEAAQC